MPRPLKVTLWIVGGLLAFLVVVGIVGAVTMEPEGDAEGSETTPEQPSQETVDFLWDLVDAAEAERVAANAREDIAVAARDAAQAHLDAMEAELADAKAALVQKDRDKAQAVSGLRQSLADQHRDDINWVIDFVSSQRCPNENSVACYRWEDELAGRDLSMDQKEAQSVVNAIWSDRGLSGAPTMAFEGDCGPDTRGCADRAANLIIILDGSLSTVLHETAHHLHWRIEPDYDGDPHASWVFRCVLVDLYRQHRSDLGTRIPHEPLIEAICAQV